MKFKNSFLSMFMALLMPMVFITHLQAQTYNTPASGTEGSTYITYLGAVDMTAGADSTASHYTKALYIGDSNQSIGVLQVEIGDSTGTEDINIFVEYSQDRYSWNSISTAVLDAATAGTSWDSLHVVGGTALIEFKSAVYMRLHFDGQTGNPAGVVDWSVYLPKNSGAPPRGVPQIADRRTS